MNAADSARALSSPQGWLQAVEARIDGQVVEITASMHGRVERVPVAEDQLVERGELLVELDHRELDRKVEAAAAELKSAAASQAARARGQFLLARLNRLAADVRAPVAGRVLMRNAQPREYTVLAQPLVSILDSDDLWALARFAVQDFDRLRIGQRARVGAGGRLFAARVGGLIPRERWALLEFIARPVLSLRPGMTVAAAVNC